MVETIARIWLSNLGFSALGHAQPNGNQRYEQNQRNDKFHGVTPYQ
ncbi:MAG: hypothetical protein LCH85_16910 [Chloroflexi bacterium]|nr:hypothetical protein [Chloroflexota bacterium]